MDELGGTTPLQLLQDDFNCGEQEIRLAAIRRIGLVGQVMGPEATRTQLMPFINSILEDDDEILLALASELGQFVPIVGGGSHANILLQPLEALAGVEETVVRECAVDSITKVVQAMVGHGDEATEMVKRLSNGDWFTARVSACGTYASVYAHLADSEARASLRSQYEVLSKDETPMVRRSAAAKLGDLFLQVEGEFIVGELMAVFKALCSDDQDSVRVLAVEQSSKVAKSLCQKGLEAECQAQVIPLVKHALEDRSWRVRHSIAKDYHRVAEAVGGAVTAAELLPVPGLNGLLQDVETEVRATTIKSLTTYVDLVGKDTFASQVMPYVKALIQDVNLAVRNTLSQTCMKLAPQLGQQYTNELIVPMLQIFLRDEAPEVRLHVLERIDAIGPWMSGPMSDQLMPLILELGRNNIWRIRKAVILAIPTLTEVLTPKYFEDNLLEMYLLAYQDSVNEVRMGASQGLHKLCAVCGSDWLLEKMMPKIRAFYDDSSFYLIRITVLNALKCLMDQSSSNSSNVEGRGGGGGSGNSSNSSNRGSSSSSGGGGGLSKMLSTDVVEMLLRGTKDQIPNVRFTAIQALQTSSPHLDDAMVQGQVRPCLVELSQSDPDADVKYFATAALESLSS